MITFNKFLVKKRTLCALFYVIISVLIINMRVWRNWQTHQT